MWLHEENLYTFVVKATEEEESWLREFLSFSATDSRYTGGKDKLYNVFNQSFPSGLLSKVKKAAEEATPRVVIEIFDKRTNILKHDPDADLAWLHDYQREAVAKVVQKRRGLVWLATGGGKTEVAIGITRALPGRWLFLAHRNTLVTQAAERFQKRSPLENVGTVVQGKWDFNWRTDALVCASFQTLVPALEAGDKRAIALLHNADGVIVDEAHVLPAESFLKVILETPNANARVGLSATPLVRGDRRSALAVASLGPIIYRVETKQLIDRGMVARPFIKMVKCQTRVKNTTWAGAYREAIVMSTKRNDLVVTAVRLAPSPCMVFVKNKAHGRVLERHLLKAGVQTRFVYGDKSEDQRKTAVRDLVAGRLDCIIASVVFQEGLDVPELRSVIIASGGKSVIAAIQRVGRGMRLAPGKTDFTVIDIADRGCGCDAENSDMKAHAGCRWLENHTRARHNAYVAEGYTVTLEDWP